MAYSRSTLLCEQAGIILTTMKKDGQMTVLLYLERETGFEPATFSLGS